MSQLLVPINGGVDQIITVPVTRGSTTVSPQYIIANSLQPRPTEWVIGGRPIYRRLPAISETYQIDFFNIVTAPNTAALAEVEDIGYIYVPWTENSAGPTSIVVSSSESQRDLLICGGRIVWKYGGTDVYPAILNLEDLQIRSGRYYLAYELLFNDDVQQNLYTVGDYALTGLPLTITSSTDSVIGWRHPAVNAFLNTSTNFWASKDTYFPTYAQPAASYLQWGSTLGQAYSQVILRCPPETAYTATASFYYVTTSGLEQFQGTVSPSVDTIGQYYQFNFTPIFNNGWKVVWSNTDVAIQSVTVTGAITLEKKSAAPSTRAALVMYPTERPPASATYCPLAYVEVDNAFKVTSIEDIRYVIRRDYVPVADWLTRFFDDRLINLYEQVKQYPRFWMSPPSCMKQEYLDLADKNIVIS